MGDITDQFNTAFRDFNTDGVPSSGDHEVVKSEVRAIGPAIESSVAALVSPYTNAAAASAQQAVDAAGIVGFLPTYPTALPNEVLSVSGGQGTGSGGTPGEYLMYSNGGPGGLQVYVTIDSTGKIAASNAYRIANPGISVSNATPTFSLSNVPGLTGATAPTATVGTINYNRKFWSPSADGTQKVAWINSSGTLTPLPALTDYLKAQIDLLTGSGVTQMAASLFTISGYLDVNGAVQSNGNFMCTDYLPVGLINVLNLKLLNNSVVRNVAYYGANNVFISGSALASSGYTTAMPAIPANAKTVRFCASTTDTGQWFVAQPNWQKFRGGFHNAEHLMGSNLWDFANERGYINTSGVLTDNANLLVSDYIAGVPGRVTSYDFYASPNTLPISFFDASKTWISTGNVAGPSVAGEIAGSVIWPANAAFMRISVINPAAVPAAALTPNTIIYGLAGSSITPGETYARNILAGTLNAGYYVNASGVVMANSAWSITSAIPVKGFRWLTYRSMAVSNVCAVAFYSSATLQDATTFISVGSILPPTGSTTPSPYRVAVQVPPNALSMILCKLVSGADGADFTSYATLSTENPAMALDDKLVLMAPRLMENPFAIPTLRSGQILKAQGNSITAGVGSSNPVTTSYAALTASALGMTLVNGGYSGETSCECVNRIMSTSDLGLSTSPSTTNVAFSLEIGTNDINVMGIGTDYVLTSGQEANAVQAITAAVNWMATRKENRVNLGAVSLPTNWSSDTTYSAAGGPLGAKSSTNGATISTPLTTYGGPVYVWSRVGNGNGGTFTINIINSSSVTVATLAVSATPVGTITTINGGTTSVNCARIPNLPAGIYTVQIVVTSATNTANDVGIISVGTPSEHAYYTSPSVLVAGVPKFRNDVAALATAQLTYDIMQIVDQAQKDGLDVRYVDNRSALDGTAATYNDLLHPNDTGHAALSKPFIEAARRAPGSKVRRGTPISSAGPGTPGDRWAWGGYLYGVQPDRTIQRVATASW